MSVHFKLFETRSSPSDTVVIRGLPFHAQGRHPVLSERENDNLECAQQGV